MLVGFLYHLLELKVLLQKIFDVFLAEWLFDGLRHTEIARLILIVYNKVGSLNSRTSVRMAGLNRPS
jgi:hypothetical protein